VIQIISRRQAVPPGPHSAFTQVGEGESLTDVAVRVYGTSEATSALWRANRDIIARRETPLEVGLVLRTP
jgi:nucleoid-associated protein YgaU